MTTAQNERLFSTMKRVKNYLRSRCGDERLSDLLLLAVLKEDVKEVNMEEVINEFARMKVRRYPLLR